MIFTEKTIDVEQIYDGKILRLELQTVELCNEKQAIREIIRHRGGVAVIPITAENEIYLVKQFRKPFDKEILEVPAGKLEENERPEECARRELGEETGFSAKCITFLSVMYPSPGYTDEKIYIYKAEGLSEGSLSPDEDEFLRVERYSLAKAVNMVKAGEIVDAKSVIGILLLHAGLNS